MERSATHSPAAMDIVSDMHDPRLELEDGAIPEKISAYYSLAFPNFTYYLQTLSVTIGRRAVRNGSASTSDISQVDVDLGPLKSVSRLHAKIEYEEDNEQFVLVVLGRNGAWVDGIWSGSGSRVPLGPRSQIQIATRIFHFVLPPPPVPEDSPSPSSPTSSSRHPSPSIDITSYSPVSSPSPIRPPVDVPPRPVLDVPLNGKDMSSSKLNGKKRKKSELDQLRPPPDTSLPRPQFTYAQLCYRAIKSMEGKATLQDICRWIAENFHWYRLNEGTGWENSIRHNLSSNRAFKKMERSSGERGKGFFWSLDPQYEATLEQQDAKTTANFSTSDVKEGGKAKAKSKPQKNVPLEPALKRSVKADSKLPLPPPLTSTPLPAFPNSINKVTPLNPESSGAQQITDDATKPNPTTAETIIATENMIIDPVGDSPPETSSSSASSNNALPGIPPDMVVPIVIGPTTPGDNSNSSITPHLSAPPIALRGDTIILNPTIFRDLTPEQLKGLEALGARKAIDILQGYIVKFLKQQIKTEGAKGKARAKAKKGAKKEVKATKAGSQDSSHESNNGSSKNVTTAQTGGESSVPYAPAKPRKVDLSQAPFTTVPLTRQPASQPQGLSGALSDASISTATLSSAAPSTAPATPEQNTVVIHSGISQPSVKVTSTSPPMGHLELPTSSHPDVDIIIDIEGPVTKKRRIEVQASA